MGIESPGTEGRQSLVASNRDLNIDMFEELKMLTIDLEKLATYRLGMEKGVEQGNA